LKFRDCASYAARRIPKKNIEKVAEQIRELENVDDVSALVNLVS